MLFLIYIYYFLTKNKCFNIHTLTQPTPIYTHSFTHAIQKQEINFIQQLCIKLLKSKRKDIYNF